MGNQAEQVAVSYRAHVGLVKYTLKFRTSTNSKKNARPNATVSYATG